MNDSKTKTNQNSPQEFKANDFMALMMLRSEYSLIKAILDMNEKGDACIGRLTESIIPYIALSDSIEVCGILPPYSLSML